MKDSVAVRLGVHQPATLSQREPAQDINPLPCHEKKFKEGVKSNLGVLSAEHVHPCKDDANTSVVVESDFCQQALGMPSWAASMSQTAQLQLSSLVASDDGSHMQKLRQLEVPDGAVVEFDTSVGFTAHGEEHISHADLDDAFAAQLRAKKGSWRDRIKVSH